VCILGYVCVYLRVCACLFKAMQWCYVCVGVFEGMTCTHICAPVERIAGLKRSVRVIISDVDSSQPMYDDSIPSSLTGLSKSIKHFYMHVGVYTYVCACACVYTSRMSVKLYIYVYAHTQTQTQTRTQTQTHRCTNRNTH